MLNLNLSFIFKFVKFCKMINRYSFLNHPFYFVLANAGQMVMGLEKSVAVFYNKSTNSTEVLQFVDKIEQLNIDDENYIDNLRKSKEKFNWIKQEQVPFEVSNDEFGQLTFDDEKKNSVLELRFLNEYDNHYDVLYLYFKSNIGNFKLANSNEAMAVAIKEVIERLLYQQISIFIQENKLNSSVHRKISKSFNHVDLQTEIERIRKEKEKQSADFYNYILQKLLINEQFEVVLSNGAIRKLSSLNIPLEKMEQVLLDSLEVIVNKFGAFNFHELLAEDVVTEAVTKQSINTSIKQEQLGKTAKFLDKYEAAAKLLSAKNEKITGLNIGVNCSPEVSPAAISDVLKKHAKKIAVLLNTYPEKWITIRKEFKPLRNIYEKQVQSHQNRMGA